MNLILHIGTHKTGTSSIQAFLEANRDALRASGYHYPQCCSVFGGNHSPLCGAMIPDPRDDRWAGSPGWDAFAEECRQAGAPTVIVSAEIFSLRLQSRERAQKVAQLFRSLFDTITVVVYLRRQDDYVRSMYIEAVKHGFFKKSHLGRTFEETAANIAGPQTDYLHLIRVLDEVFGREHLRLRVFEKGQLHPGGLLADFLETCGIPAAGLDQAAVADVNVSPGRKVVAAMGLAREIYERIYGTETGRHHRESLMGGVHGILMEAWPGDRKFVGYRPGNARELVGLFQKSNETIAREYLGRADGVLFRDERYTELSEGERDEATLTRADVTFILEAFDISEAQFGHVTPAGERVLAVVPQLFLDKGSGFREADSVMRRHYVRPGGTVVFTVPCPDGVGGVRLDPAFDFCVLSIDHARAVRADGGSSALRERASNALRADDGRLYFDTTDPWIVYEQPRNCERLEFSLTYHEAGPGAAALCLALLKKGAGR